jgi:hypothetical protein
MGTMDVVRALRNAFLAGLIVFPLLRLHLLQHAGIMHPLLEP